MSKPTHILELNGRIYDAVTGRVLTTSKQSLDGVLPAHSTNTSFVHTPFTASNEGSRRHPPTTKNPEVASSRGPVHPTQRHRVQHSQTLMRHAVHHPGNSLKRTMKVAGHTGALTSKIQFDIVPKHSAMIVDEDRFRRARTIARSQLISRFDVHERASRSQPTYQQRQIAEPLHRPNALSVTSSDSMDIFERALAAAHNPAPRTAPHKKKTGNVKKLRRVTRVATTLIAILLIAGFVAYQNAAVIQLRLASSRAGIAATLPTWQPSGFQLGTFAYSPGSVTVTYSNPASGQEFNIVQSSSNWDSAALLSDFVYPNNTSYDTINTNGNTIYTYGNNNATWVSGGIWYKLTTNSSLSTSQLVNIASSMHS